MRKTPLVAGAVLILLIALAGGWYVFSPGWTVRAMIDAARDRDEAAFSSHVDYPALRADMKTELTARLQAQAKRDAGPQGKLALAVGTALLPSLVDRLVSPKAMEEAFGRLGDERFGTAAAKTAGAAASGGKVRRRMPEIRRESFNRFLVSSPDAPEAGLVFERRGLGWKLAGIDLPRDEARRAVKR